MNFHTRKWVKPEDLNPNGTLFGGSLLRWIDEEAAIYAIIQLGRSPSTFPRSTSSARRARATSSSWASPPPTSVVPR